VSWIDKCYWIFSSTDVVTSFLNVPLIKNFDKKYIFNNSLQGQSEFLKKKLQEHIYIKKGNVWLLEHGWGAFGLNKLIPFSNQFYFSPSPWNPIPSSFKYLLKTRLCRIYEIADQGIVFPNTWDNYYHFFIDILPQIIFWLSREDRKNVPFLIPKRVKKIEFAYKVLECLRSELESKILYYDDSKPLLIRNESYFLQTSRFENTYLKEVVEKICNEISHDGKTYEKIFLVRKSRTIKNQEEIESYLKSYGYQIVDASELQWEDQVRMFRSVKSVVAIHGAGITNIIFRLGLPLRLFEIVPKNKSAYHYAHLATDMNFEYFRFTGGVMSYPLNNFSFDIEELQKKSNFL